VACLGIHFALTDAQRTKLLALRSDEERIDYVKEDIEEGWDKEYACETDKAWDAIHRCLTEHPPQIEELKRDVGTYPLKLCVAGGRKLLDDEYDYIIRLIEPSEVADLAAALQPIDKDWLSARYWKHCEGAWPEYSEEDMEYTWEYFVYLRDFLTRIAPTGRSVIFSVDQ